ncbi:MAG: DUF4377 domain-containing protein [Aquaticitalea sp.]
MNSKLIVLVFSLALFFSCSNDNEKTFFIADTRANCTGVAPQKCLQIRENEKDDWTYFYGNIEGFDYEPGYSYKLKVEITNIENPPADASSKKYSLIEVLQKTKSAVTIATGSWMVTKIKDNSEIERNPIISLVPSQGEIHGSTGCNKFFGKVVIEKSSFKVNTIGSTKMMCQNMDTEQLFLETLNEVSSYKIEKDLLKLMNAQQQILMECSFMPERE